MAGGENEVAVVSSEEFRGKVLKVQRYSALWMWVLNEAVINYLINVYESQAGCNVTGKVKFSGSLGAILRGISL